MYSIYHFFAHLYRNRELIKTIAKLDKFPYDPELLSCSNSGKFPDLAIRVNLNGHPPGGELVELKDSKSYTVSSFNSTIPTGKKSIDSITQGKTNKIREQMESVGDDIHALPIRDVYYLIRGKKNNSTKVCLIHGSFFETVRVDELIQQAFNQVLEERLLDSDEQLDDETRKLLLKIFSSQDSFRKVRNVKNASVKLRFRIMTEVKREGNILNPKSYPQIEDNTLNLVIPQHSDSDIEAIQIYVSQAFATTELIESHQFALKHPFNGMFFVLTFAI